MSGLKRGRTHADDTGMADERWSPTAWPPRPGETPGDPLPSSPSRSPRRRSWMAWRLVVAIIVFAAALGLRIVSSPSDSCVTKGIATAAGREGRCTRGSALSGTTTYVVVDAGHALRMPGYSMTLLATRVAPYRPAGVAGDPSDYPAGVGALVSMEVSVTDDGTRPLALDPAQSALLVHDERADSAEGEGDRAMANGDAQPGPTLGGSELAPGQTRTGWMSFIVPAWVPSVLHVRAADLQIDWPSGDAGQIRLWKYADAQGAAALGLTPGRSPATSPSVPETTVQRLPGAQSA